MNIWNRLGRVSEYFTSLYKLQHRSSSVIYFGCFRWENFPKNEHLKCLQSLSFFKPCGKKKMHNRKFNHGNPLQCSCLENPRDGGAWWAAIYGVAQSQTRLKRLSSSSRCISSVQFSLSVVFDSLWPDELHYARSPCPSTTPGVHPNPCPLCRWCHPTISSLCRHLLHLPSIFPSIRVFSNESSLCIRWQKYWSFSFNISLSNEHPGLISFRTDWLDLLAVQGTSRALSNTTVQKHQFFCTQLSL